MKKALTVLSMFIFLAGSVMATNASLFSYDADQVNSEMSDLNALEDYVANNDVTYEQLQAQNSELVANVSAPSGFASVLAQPPLGIPSFVWGFCLSWVGILVVYLITESKDESMKALWGCIAGGVAYAIFYIIYVALIVGTSTI